MRISRKSYPIIEDVFSGLQSGFNLHDKDLALIFKEDFVSVFWNAANANIEIFKKNIYIVSKTFEDAMNSARGKLSALYDDIVFGDELDFSVGGTFIMGDYVSFFSHSFKAQSKDAFTTFLVFTKEGFPILMMVDDVRLQKGVFGWISQGFVTDQPKDLSFLRYMASRLILLDMFRTYAEVETVFVGPGKKADVCGQKHLNELEYPITFLDSRWFRNIVRSEGFAVRGHFRLQPKKANGEWTRELIWINDFEKHGYTSKARISNQYVAI